MGFEFDFFRVGDSTKAGDAILFRFGELLGKRKSFFTVLIDGGTKDTGDDIANHLTECYQTDKIDLMINTHPDGDHIGGLVTLLENENIQINQIVMNKPWDYTEEMKEYLNDGRITENSFIRRLRDSFRLASCLERLANEREIEIKTGFEGQMFLGGALTVLSPSEDHYKNMLMQSDKTPEMTASNFDEASSLMKAYAEKTAELASARKITESLEVELLEDPEENSTSFINNSAISLLVRADGFNSILTADIGVESLAKAFQYATDKGVDLSDLHLFQVPHHGSRRNIGPTILEKIKGKKAIISSPKTWEDHPSKKVINALIRRDWNVFCTRKPTSHFYHEAPDREKYTKIEKEKFYFEYDD